MTSISTIQEQAALINYGIFSTDPYKRKRYELLSSLQTVTRSKYLKWCQVIHEAVIAVADQNGNISLHNVQTCQSRHTCPVCTSRFMAEQRSKMMDLTSTWQNDGGQVVMGTFTLPNRTPMDFRYSYKRLVEVGAVFRRLAKNYERKIRVPASVRTLEETLQVGRGIHAHFHFIWLIPADTDVQDFVTEMKSLWLRAAKTKGINGVSSNAQHIELVEPTRLKKTITYITKHGYVPTAEAPELASKGSLSPFEALSVAVSGDADWLELWHSFELSVKGKHRVMYYDNAPKAAGV